VRGSKATLGCDVSTAETRNVALTHAIKDRDHNNALCQLNSLRGTNNTFIEAFVQPIE
jgi:hypothetical protein